MNGSKGSLSYHLKKSRTTILQTDDGLTATVECVCDNTVASGARTGAAVSGLHNQSIAFP